MKNITLSIDDDLLEEGRKYAQKHHVSFNSLVRKLLSTAVHNESDDWLQEWFKLIEKLNYRSGGRRDWKREDLYRV